MNEIIKSTKRLIDLVYIILAFWAIGEFIEWIMMFGS